MSLNYYLKIKFIDKYVKKLYIINKKPETFYCSFEKP